MRNDASYSMWNELKRLTKPLLHPDHLMVCIMTVIIVVEFHSKGNITLYILFLFAYLILRRPAGWSMLFALAANVPVTLFLL